MPACRTFGRTLPLLALLGLLVAAPSASATPEPRVIGGSKVGQGEYDQRWRSIVSLRAAGSSPTLRAHFCAGVLVAERYVVTARHCIESNGWMAGRPADLMVKGATPSLTSGGGTARVGAIFRSPEAAGGWHQSGGDIAVLRLQATIPGAVPLPLARHEHASWWGGGTGRDAGAFVAGWGVIRDADVRREREFGPGSAQLLSAEVPIVAEGRCARSVPWDPSVRRHICAGAAEQPRTAVTEARTSCYGDSGGPLIATDPAGVEPPRLVGIVSRGTDLQCSRGQGIYVKVADHADWIDRIVAQEGQPSLRGRPEYSISERSAVGRFTIRLAAPPAANEHHIVEVRAVGAKPWLELGRFSGQDRAIALPPTRRGSAQVRLRAVVDGIEQHVSSVWVESTPRDASPPNPVRRLTARRVGFEHRLAWTPARDRQDRVLAYYIEQRPAGRGGPWRSEAFYECFPCWTDARVKLPTRGAHVLLPGRREFRISAMDRAGNWSAWAYAR